MRTILSLAAKSVSASHRATSARTSSLRAGVTASSKSSTRLSAALARDFASIRSLPPGTKWSERRSW